MNNKPNYKKGYRLLIIKTILNTGTLEYSNLELINSQKNIIQRTILKMEKEGYLKIEKSLYGKRIILVNDFKKWITEFSEYIPVENLIEYKRYLPDLKKSIYANEAARYERLATGASARLFFYLTGAKSYVDERHKLIEEKRIDEDSINYYPIHELRETEYYKSAQGVDEKRPRNSRVRGICVSPGEIYAVYSLNKNLIEWNQYGENKIKHMIEWVMASKQKINTKVNMLVLSNKIELIERIIWRENVNGKRSYMAVDDVYDSIYTLPLDENGIKHMKIMQRPQWQEEMLSEMLPDKDFNKKAVVLSNVLCDAIAKDKTYVLLFCIPDIKKLKAFIKKAAIEDTNNYAVYCFNYQMPLIEKIVGQYAQIYSLDINEYIEHINGVGNDKD